MRSSASLFKLHLLCFVAYTSKPTLAFAFLARNTTWCSQNGSELRGGMKTIAHILNRFYRPMQFYMRSCIASRPGLKMLNTHSICQKMLIDIQQWTITGVIFMNSSAHSHHPDGHGDNTQQHVPSAATQHAQEPSLQATTL